MTNSEDVTPQKHIELIYIGLGLFFGLVTSATVILWPWLIWVYALIAIGVVIDGIVKVLKH